MSISRNSTIDNKRSLPSLFGPSPRSNRSSLLMTIPDSFETKFSKVDKLFKNISNLNSDKLASALLAASGP